MITISLSVAIGLYVTLLLAGTLIYWIFTVRNENQEFKNHTFGEPTKTCPICGYVFAALPKGGVTECPQCHSLFDYKEDAKK